MNIKNKSERLRTMKEAAVLLNIFIEGRAEFLSTGRFSDLVSRGLCNAVDLSRRSNYFDFDKNQNLALALTGYARATGEVKSCLWWPVLANLDGYRDRNERELDARRCIDPRIDFLTRYIKNRLAAMALEDWTNAQAQTEFKGIDDAVGWKGLCLYFRFYLEPQNDIEEQIFNIAREMLAENAPEGKDQSDFYFCSIEQAQGIDEYEDGRSISEIVRLAVTPRVNFILDIIKRLGKFPYLTAKDQRYQAEERAGLETMKATVDELATIKNDRAARDSSDGWQAVADTYKKLNSVEYEFTPLSDPGALDRFIAGEGTITMNAAPYVSNEVRERFFPASMPGHIVLLWSSGDLASPKISSLKTQEGFYLKTEKKKPIVKFRLMSLSLFNTVDLVSDYKGREAVDDISSNITHVARVEFHSGGKIVADEILPIAEFKKRYGTRGDEPNPDEIPD